MKLTEIAERLAREFPGVYVAVDMCAHSHPGSIVVECSIYSEAAGHIACRTLEEGIAAMHQALNPKPPEIDVDVDDAGEIGERKDGEA